LFRPPIVVIFTEGFYRGHITENVKLI